LYLFPSFCYAEKRPSYKNLLQEWAHKNNKQLPVYHPELEGQVHQPQFRSTVEVDGKRYRSQQSHSRRRDAEQDAALVAYVDLSVKIIDVDDAAAADDDLLGLIERVFAFV
jgi:dsRNA-specific ribonuclease